MIFRTPPDPRLKSVGLYCAAYDEAGPPVRPIGNDGTRSRSGENSGTGIIFKNLHTLKGLGPRNPVALAGQARLDHDYVITCACDHGDFCKYNPKSWVEVTP